MILLNKEFEKKDLWIHAKNEEDIILGFILVGFMESKILRLHKIQVYSPRDSDDGLDHRRSGVGALLLHEAAKLAIDRDHDLLVGTLIPTPFTQEALECALLFYAKCGVSYIPDKKESDLEGKLALVQRNTLALIRKKGVQYR